VLAGVPSESRASEQVPLDQIQDAIREGCERILRTQREDGALVIDTRHFGPEGVYVYPVGVVSLGVLALEHALPHLKGETATRARDAVQKGLAWISQQKLDPMTYSAGLVLSALYQDHPDKHRRLIGDYAEMLVISQHQKGHDTGFWGYNLYLPQRYQARDKALPTLLRGDHSNTQFAVLGLLFAEHSGFQIPKKTWSLLRQHYIDFQNQDGGWSYGPDYARKGSYANMTLASTISLAICEEMLFAGEHRQCVAPPESRPVEKGLQWIGENLKYDELETYGFYALERLGILSGLSEFGGKAWFDEGAVRLAKNRNWQAHACYGTEVGTAFAVLFLSRGLEPVIINKLKRTGDWDNDPYDIKHLVEYITTYFQHPKQWRIVTLKADVDFLLRVPILYVSGHETLQFTDAEKDKLKQYVEQGGTIFAMACCAKGDFDKSFRSLLAELWPGETLQELPKTHPVYENPRPLATRPQLLGLSLNRGQGRLGVIYSPHDMCCRWHMGGTRAKPVFDVGTNIFFYVDKIASKDASPAPPVQAPEREKK
jgi:hypothetical protein